MTSAPNAATHAASPQQRQHMSTPMQARGPGGASVVGEAVSADYLLIESETAIR